MLSMSTVCLKAVVHIMHLCLQNFIQYPEKGIGGHGVMYE